MALGSHLICELSLCNVERLNDIEFIRNTLLEAARRSGATIITDVMKQFEPQGVTGVVVLAESHISIHTWPERAYAAVDFYTCGEHTNPAAGMKYIRKALECRYSEGTEIDRGFIGSSNGTCYSQKVVPPYGGRL